MRKQFTKTALIEVIDEKVDAVLVRNVGGDPRMVSESWWVPRHVFESTYKELNHNAGATGNPMRRAGDNAKMDGNGMLTFGGAIQALKQGKKVARHGWNGKGMWIVMMPPLSLPPHSTQEPGAKVNDRTAKHIGVDTPLDSQAYISMWTAAQQWQPGWLASQPDMLSDDWTIVE